MIVGSLCFNIHTDAWKYTLKNEIASKGCFASAMVCFA
jgi:hypothetical protein